MFYDMGASSARNDERSKRYTSTYAADAAKHVEKDCAGRAGKALVECMVEIVDATRESQRAESDLGAQWQAANWVAWATIIAGVQLVATILGLVYIRETLLATVKAVEDTGVATQAMKDANLIADRTSRQQLRAYLTPEIAVVEWHPNGINYKITISFKNTGGTPATKASIQWGSMGTDNYDPEIDYPGELGPLFSSSIVGPGQQLTVSAEKVATIEVVNAINGDRGAILAKGVILYRDSFDEVQTVKFQFAYNRVLSGNSSKMAATPKHNEMT